MKLTREILDLIEDYWDIAEIEVGDDYINIQVNDPVSDARYAVMHTVEIEYSSILREQGFTPYKFYSAGSVRYYIKKER